MDFFKAIYCFCRKLHAWCMYSLVTTNAKSVRLWYFLEVKLQSYRLISMRTLFFFFGHSKDIIVKIMLLPKPVDKILLPYNISDLFRRRLQIAIFPVQLASIQLPCFPTKIFNNAPVNASLIFWFYSLEKICPVTWTLPWEITKYLIDRQTFWSNRNDPYAGIWTTQKGGRLSMQVTGFS